ncbi:hypothetical protein [Lichenihabitans psoromatis]|uniref:hypothetical protein n=1 Tax=Lichenihabitans psoromatis TaxID=2528642 RepID=UPI001036E552|nr:hypothetical protein [Lichenihabitans psoromatis]
MTTASASLGRWARRALRLPTIAIPLMDQGIVSAGTFLFNVLLARAIPLESYGHFAIVIGILALMQAGCGSLIFYPLSVRGAAQDEVGRKNLIVSVIALAPMILLPMAAILSLGFAWLVDPNLLLPTFAMLAASQVQELMRRGLLTEFRYLSAIPGDILSFFGQAAVLTLVSHRIGMTLPIALWIMAATSLIGAVAQWSQLSLRSTRLLPLRPMTADFWSIGHWSLTTNVLGIGRTMCLPWLLVALSGPSLAGAFQIGMNLVNVVNPIVFGVCNVVPQLASRAMRGGYRAAWGASWPSIAAGLPIVGGFVTLLMIAPSEILAFVYGSRADPAMLVWPIRILAIGAMFYYVGSTVCAYLHGVLGGRDALIADVIATLAMAVAGPVLVGLYGLKGACLALLAAFAIRSSVLIVYTVIRLRSDDVQRPVGNLEHRETAG